MSVYQPKYNCIFIHIPKTAGTSMELALCGTPMGHLPIMDYHLFWERGAVGMPRWKDVFKFCFVRNPWERLVSIYYHGQDSAKSFPDFVKDIKFPTGLPIGLHGPRIKGITRQIQFITNYHGEILVDFIGRYENLQEDWAKVCERIGLNEELTHRNTGREHGYYKDYYTKELWDRVAELYRRDIDEFGYGEEF